MNTSFLSTVADELLESYDRKQCLINIHDEDSWEDREKIKMNNDSPIQDFYKEQTIFITGATGFLGSLLVEKFLRCCPQIHKLILLVRSKSSKSVEERIRDYFNNEIFDRMRLANPKYFEKVDIVCGHLDADNFGLNPRDQTLLTSQTSIVFHIAATVRFDEHIRTAYNINVQGTQTLIAMAKKMPHLKSFVYVSTAYCNCDRRYIEEKFYPPTLTSQELSILVNYSSDEEMAILKEHLVDRKPNTYTLTKATAEDLVREALGELPICVFRPSIVFPTLKEPMPLWMKGFNGVLALCLAAGTGLLRVSLQDSRITVDLVPADRTINAMTTLAWYQTTSRPILENRNVFNYVSYCDNNVNLSQFVDFIRNVTDNSEESCSQILWKHGTTMTNNVTLFYILFYLLHLIPSIVFTCAEKLTRRKPVIMMYYRKIFFCIKTLATFTLNEWQFENRNTRAMVDATVDVDRAWFDSSMTNFRWESMIVNIPRSIAKYTLQDPLTKEHYQKKMSYIILADDCLRYIIRGAVLYLFISFVANFINYFYIS